MNTEQIQYRFSDKTVVVTGASGGIGQEVALSFARAGARLILHVNKNAKNVASLADNVKNVGGKAEVIQADFENEQSCPQFLSAVLEKAPRIDVWVNAAGIDLMAPTMAGLSFDEKMQKIIEVDVFAAIRLSRQVCQIMEQSENGGHLFFFGWNGVELGWKGETAQLYGLAKGAIQGFCRNLAENCSPKVHIRCLSLGWIKTRWGTRASDEIVERIQKDSLQNRWGTPKDVAEMILFLSSNVSEYIDATNLRLDGIKRGNR